MAKASDNLFPYVHLVPAVAPASPASGSQRLYLDSGNSNKLTRKDSSGTVTVVEGGTGTSGGILAQKIYNPGTITTYTITATTITDVDSTNLAVTFTAPASGNVLVTLQGLHQIPNGAASAYTSLYWGLRESTTTLHEKVVFGGAFLSSAAWDMASCMRYVITGISAGSHTYKWAHRLDAASKTATLYAGGAAGQTVMTVETLP